MVLNTIPFYTEFSSFYQSFHQVLRQFTIFLRCSTQDHLNLKYIISNKNMKSAYPFVFKTEKTYLAECVQIQTVTHHIRIFTYFRLISPSCKISLPNSVTLYLQRLYTKLQGEKLYRLVCSWSTKNCTADGLQNVYLRLKLQKQRMVILLLEWQGRFLPKLNCWMTHHWFYITQNNLIPQVWLN